VNSWIAITTKRILNIGFDPSESEEEQFKKRLFVAAVFMMIPASVVWGTLFFYFEEIISASLSWGYALFSLLSLLLIQYTKRYWSYLYCHMAFGLVVPALQTILLGGFQASGGQVLWAIISPIAALFYLRIPRALPWWGAYLMVMILAGLAQRIFPVSTNLPPEFGVTMFVMNLAVVSMIVLVALNYFIRQREEAYRLLRIEQEKAEDLLLNILPREIAAILKNEKRTIADQFDGVSILFADLVGFTQLTARMAPVEMVNLLNQIFSHFDSLIEKYQVEKIRTIGDNYMVAAGVPRPRRDHAKCLAEIALQMRDYVESLPPVDGNKIHFRIGINSGPVVGGVIGRKKFVYDVWGDAVNIASRMESQGMAGKIQVTQATYELIEEEFICQPRGSIEVKGRGEMQTYILIGERQKEYVGFL
jgi:adenylate cyclase